MVLLIKGSNTLCNPNDKPSLFEFVRSSPESGGKFGVYERESFFGNCVESHSGKIVALCACRYQ